MGLLSWWNCWMGQTEVFANAMAYLTQLARILPTASPAVKHHQSRVTQKQRDHYDVRVPAERYRKVSWFGSWIREGRGG